MKNKQKPDNANYDKPYSELNRILQGIRDVLLKNDLTSKERENEKLKNTKVKKTKKK